MRKILFTLVLILTIFTVSADQTFREFIPTKKISQDIAVTFPTDI